MRGTEVVEEFENVQRRNGKLASSGISLQIEELLGVGSGRNAVRWRSFES
jgi:hypothetical protein